MSTMRLMGAGCVVLACIGLTGCGSIAPTAWIGKNTPKDVGEGEFPKLSDIPERPELPESDEERGQIASELAEERDRLQSTAQTIFPAVEAQNGEQQEGSP